MVALLIKLSVTRERLPSRLAGMHILRGLPSSTPRFSKPKGNRTASLVKVGHQYTARVGSPCRSGSMYALLRHRRMRSTRKTSERRRGPPLAPAHRPSLFSRLSPSPDRTTMAVTSHPPPPRRLVYPAPPPRHPSSHSPSPSTSTAVSVDSNGVEKETWKAWSKRKSASWGQTAVVKGTLLSDRVGGKVNGYAEAVSPDVAVCAGAGCTCGKSIGWVGRSPEVDGLLRDEPGVVTGGS